ncbi:hypothetical protein TNCV_2865581 [Trichonephila clavipes]|nr:hypothetical protein TNCV_2865581 [Trichonephila clavipes]
MSHSSGRPALCSAASLRTDTPRVLSSFAPTPLQQILDGWAISALPPGPGATPTPVTRSQWAITDGGVTSRAQVSLPRERFSVERGVRRNEANPQVYVETPLHPEKLTVWCTLWAGGIIGPYFCKNDELHNVTVNGDRYKAMITNFFIPELNNHDIQELWF